MIPKEYCEELSNAKTIGLKLSGLYIVASSVAEHLAIILMQQTSAPQEWRTELSRG